MVIHIKAIRIFKGKPQTVIIQWQVDRFKGRQFDTPLKVLVEIPWLLSGLQLFQVVFWKASNLHLCWSPNEPFAHSHQVPEKLSAAHLWRTLNSWTIMEQMSLGRWAKDASRIQFATAILPRALNHWSLIIRTRLKIATHLITTNYKGMTICKIMKGRCDKIIWLTCIIFQAWYRSSCWNRPRLGVLRHDPFFSSPQPRGDPGKHWPLPGANEHKWKHGKSHYEKYKHI